MDYKKKYEELKDINNLLSTELESLRSKESVGNSPKGTMLSAAFQSAYQLMALMNLKTGQLVDVNEAFLKVLGYTRNEVLGKTSDDIGLYADIEESSKYLKLVSRLNRIKDFVISLKTKSGEEKPFLFSAETLQYENDTYLMIAFSPMVSRSDLKISQSSGKILEEIFNTVTSYLALFSIGADNRYYIVDVNSKVEEVEFIDKNEIIGKCLDDTPLSNRIKIRELLDHLRITRESHKLSASPSGDDSEGFYMGFILTSGNIIITWEPSGQQKRQDNFYKQNVAFEEIATWMPVMVYEVDLNGRVQYGNKLGLDFFGYTKEDLNAGILISEVFPNSYRQMIDNLAALKYPGEISSNEYTGRKKDGTLVPIMTRSFAVFHDGKITGYRGTVNDMSRQKAYEDQIRREKAFLEHLIDSTPEAIAITDLEGKVTMINMEFTNIFGYTLGEAANKFIDDLVVPEESRDDSVSQKTLVAQGKAVAKHTIRKDKSGNRIQMTVTGTAIVVNNETVAYLGIYRDITTERKNQLLQEILYNISSAALKQMDIKEMYPTIVKELSKIWDTNNFFIALYDQTNDTLSLPFFADEKDNFYEIPTAKTITGYVIKNNKSVLLKENDLRLLEESGDIDLIGTPCKVWMGVPLKVENSIIGVMCLQDYENAEKFSKDDLYVLDFIANQIAIAIQRRMILDNLIVARQKAEEAALSKQIFMSTMSHEIRTPLNEVIGITNLLLQGNPREDQMDFIKTLRFSGNHLLTLVNDVLDYNKMESGKIIFEQVQFNFNDFMDEIVRSYSFRSKAKHLEFVINQEKNVPAEVIGDQIRLNQILSNLLSNALKFTNQGGITIGIREIERVGNQSKLEFSVHDTGIGIPKDKHLSIFESFTQASADTTRQYGGSGLGLAICKKLIELQGGLITLDSEPGQGSTFTFTLNLGIAENHALRKEEAAESFSGLEGKRILVAEDNKINFFVANKFLTGWGVIVTHAENGQLALDKLETEEYDLILMDLHMPVLDGIEATKIIRNSDNPKIKNIPIVALTAAIMSESHDKIEELNINDYVLKPFKPKDLFDRILKHIR